MEDPIPQALSNPANTLEMSTVHDQIADQRNHLGTELQFPQHMGGCMRRSRITRVFLPAVNWLGTEIQRYPSDLILYQELIYNQEPEMTIETGTYKGGLSIYLATIWQRSWNM